MKKLASFLLILCTFFQAMAQNNIDSLQQRLRLAKTDTDKVFALCQLSKSYLFSKPDSAHYYAKQALDISKEGNYKKGEAQSLTLIGNVYGIKSNYTKAFETHVQALKIYEERNDLVGIGATYNNIALIYDDQAEYRKALENYLKTNTIFEKLKANDPNKFIQLNIYNHLLIVFNNIGNDYEKLNLLDSALYYQDKAYTLALQINDKNNIGTVMANLGNINHKLDHDDVALKQYRASIEYSRPITDLQTITDAYYGVAKLYEKRNKLDSALFYSHQSFQSSSESSYLKGKQKASLLLSELYTQKNNSDSAFAYFKTADAIKDSIVSNDVTRQLQLMSFNEQLRQQEISAEKKQYQNRLKLYGLAGGILILMVLAGGLMRNNRHKQKANLKLRKQKEKTEAALEDLKATQARLIQSEKMASLGELTAGIAHEIQNPLNFVNNFSEVNADLIDEMKEEIKAGNMELVNSLAEMLQENNVKVANHGKRADAIVKSMLEHSRNTGRMEPTDLNALTLEFLGLSYHGLRAKDKSFNATLHTDFDDSMGKTNVNPQYIGRVLLNLLNNAFYSVAEKKKAQNGSYEPTVWVSTKRVDNNVQVCIKDNGLGIPQSILDKIYQPFFTTKPTGKGTGLGLSLSYDIITKEHGGDLQVDTEEGEFAEFVITLPVSL